MHDTQVAELSVIGMRGCEEFVKQVDYYLKEWRRHCGDESFIVNVEFSTKTPAPLNALFA